MLGAIVAAWCFDDLSLALVCFVAATLAPTDAALSAQVINDEQIPMRLRRALNVESGLNDGIVTPIVAFTLAVAATELGVPGAGHSPEGDALRELAVGVGVGLAVGLGSGLLIALGVEDGAGSSRVADDWPPWPRRSAASRSPWPCTATASSRPSWPGSPSERS